MNYDTPGLLYDHPGVTYDFAGDLDDESPGLFATHWQPLPIQSVITTKFDKPRDRAPIHKSFGGDVSARLYPDAFVTAVHAFTFTDATGLSAMAEVSADIRSQSEDAEIIELIALIEGDMCHV